MPLPGRFTLIECGQNKADGPRLLGYSNLGRSVTVMDKTRKKVWEVSAFLGVDGAYWSDLDDNGTDR